MKATIDWSLRLNEITESIKKVRVHAGVTDSFFVPWLNKFVSAKYLTVYFDDDGSVLYFVQFPEGVLS